jgi:hypothetical protein
MESARWLPAHIVAQRFGVCASALFRYSQRGMLAARWDEASASWLYDAFRVRTLFVMRASWETASAQSFGVLGEARLAGAAPRRRPPACSAESAPEAAPETRRARAS